MKSKYILLFMALAVTTALHAQNVPLQKAKTVAQNFRYGQTKILPNVQQTLTQYYKGRASYHIIQFEGGGYTAVSADDSYRPILMYNLTETYDTNEPNPAFEWWMEGYSQTIDSLRKLSIRPTIYAADWQKYDVATADFIAAHRDAISEAIASPSPSIEQLIFSTWDQKKPYNDSIQGGNCGNEYGYKCPVGYAAIALGQVMRYWGHPKEAFDWKNMPNKLSYLNSTPEQKAAVAKFLRTVGDSIGVVYCSDECQSSASINDVAMALWKYGYVRESSSAYAANPAQWITKLKNSLGAFRPVIVHGKNGLNQSHQFIIDGYKYNEDLFHFNYGNNDGKDGYFSITNHEYSRDMGALFFIEPDACDRSFDICRAIHAYDSREGAAEFFSNILHTPPVCGKLKTAGADDPASERTIQAGRTATYKAYKEIIIDEGFTVEKGAVFSGKIIDCPAN